MKLLITAFDPFGGEKINPASEAMKALPDYILDAQIIKLEIPTVFHQSKEMVYQFMQEYRPDVVLNLGQASGRSALTPERIAINQDDARIPDNNGQQPVDQPIQEEGPAAYFSTLPLKAMVKKILDTGLPAQVSNSAGTFVCNHIMYQTLHLTATEFPQTKAGFMHVPFLPQQVKHQPHQPSMSLTDIIRGLQAAIEAIILYHNQGDLVMIGGSAH